MRQWQIRFHRRQTVRMYRRSFAHRRFILQAAFALLLTGLLDGPNVGYAAILQAPKRSTTDSRTPVPSDTKQRKSLALVKSIFKKDYAGIRRLSAKQMLARKLLDVARKTTDDPAARYVMLKEAKRFALQAGDAQVAIDAVDEIAASFAVDEFDEKSAVLQKLAGSVRTPALAKTVAEAILEVSTIASNDGNFDGALNLLRAANRAASRYRNRALLKKIADVRSSITASQKRHAAIRAARQRLKNNPNDSVANSIVGKHLCFEKNDWAAGLKLLAKSNDAGLKSLAALELKNPSNAKKRMELADAWWARNENSRLSKAERTAAIVRAVTWYRLAAPALTGLYKTKVNARLAEVTKKKLLPAGAVTAKINPVEAKNGDMFWFSGRKFSTFAKHALIPTASAWPNQITDVEAACYYDGKVYLFKGTRFTAYSIAKKTSATKLPMRIGAEFPGVFPGNIDACFRLGKKIYFLRKTDYVIWDGGQPKGKQIVGRGKIAKLFPGMFTNDVDAAITGGGNLYFFKGPSYTCWHIDGNRLSHGAQPTTRFWVSVGSPSVKNTAAVSIRDDR